MWDGADSPVMITFHEYIKKGVFQPEVIPAAGFEFCRQGYT